MKPIHLIHTVYPTFASTTHLSGAYACSYVAIRRRRACARDKAQAGKDRQRMPCANSKYSSLKLLQVSSYSKELSSQKDA